MSDTNKNTAFDLSALKSREGRDQFFKAKNMDLISLIVFAVFFLLNWFLMVKFTNTALSICGILLVCQVLLAVCLGRLTYAWLIGLGIVELIAGIVSGNLLLIVLCLVVYLLSLLVIHIQHLNGGFDFAKLLKK